MLEAVEGARACRKASTGLALTIIGSVTVLYTIYYRYIDCEISMKDRSVAGMDGMMLGRIVRTPVHAIVVLFLIGCNLALPADEYTNITCLNKLFNIKDYSELSNGEILKLRCPLDCDKFKYTVYGSGPYFGKSSICRAAIHSGNLESDGHVAIMAIKGRLDGFDIASNRNGIRTESANHHGYGGFYVLKMESNPLSLTTAAHLSNETQKSKPGNELSKSSQFPSTTLKTTYGSSIKASLRTKSVPTRPSMTPPTETTTSAMSQKLIESLVEEQQSTAKEDLSTSTETPKNSSLKSTAERVMVTSVKVSANSTFLGMGFTGIEVASNEMFDQTIEKILLVVMFAVGVPFGICIYVILRRKIWKKWRRTRTKRNRNSKSDEEHCVCYQTLDSSMQGLLNDPETCQRRCSNKTQETNVFNPEHWEKTPKVSQKREICYEDECKDKCSGNCNPGMFEF